MDHFSALSKDLQLRILSFLDAPSVLSLGCCSREWFRLTACEQALWQGLCTRDQAPMRRHVEQRRALGACWRAAYRSAAALQALDCLAWKEPLREAGTSRPRRREGHAACSWGRSGMLLSSGFGGGIVSDLHLLLPTSGAAGTAFRWVQPRLAGTPPLPRYGHTLTRCGRNGDMAVLFGGLMAGGYQGPLDTLAVLRRRQPGGVGGNRGGREQETSLGRRQGGQGPGRLMQMLLAEQLFEEMQGWGGEGDGTDGNSEEYEGEFDDSDGDGMYNTAAVAAAVAAAAARGSSSDGSSDADEGSSEPDESSSESDDGSGDGGEFHDLTGAPRSRCSRSCSDGGSSGGDSGAEGARRRSVLEALLAGGGGGSPGAERASAPGADWPLEEDAWLAEGEGEWWYPPVSGEAPGPRGYHSAAASEDGSKIYFFGGLAEQGACASLAVLDVETWEFSRPATGGEAPSPRLGHSSCVFGGRLWVVGGGSGRDLLRSGRDLDDVYCLDLETMEWSCVSVSGEAPLCAGKCHASVLVGRRLLFFAGSMHTCNELAWLDLEQLAWGRPSCVAGDPPHERMSATAVLGGNGKVLVFGGYTFAYREVADLHVLDLLPTKDELKRLRLSTRPAGASSTGRAAGRSSWRGFWW